ncbi:MAG TPA: NAD(P)-dependent oxidoreductase [Mycobacteriales bacterium]|nr:NAD(P)-dependent oxidoreductase [Mycobacteriales bacterium]
MSGARILVTGVTSEVAKPVALALAKDNEVTGAARFRDPAARQPLHEGGVKTAHLDLVRGAVDDLPEKVDYVLHFAVVKSGKWAVDLDGNVSGLAMLMERYADATGFLHCSTTAVYQPDGHTAFSEESPLGDSHRNYYLPTYSICKIAAEATARHGARRYGLPTTIARLNVPYGDAGGWPAFHLALMMAGQEIAVHPDAPSEYHPLHYDDIVAMVPRLLEIADVPATTVNWGGDERVSVEEWCAYLGELTGLQPKLVASEQSLASVCLDLTKMHELVGHSTVKWRDGFRHLVETQHPELLR